MARRNDVVSPDTLAAKFDTLRTGVRSGLIDFLGKDLYSVLESREIGTNAPFGFKSKFNIEDQSLNLRKKLGKDWQFDLDINKKSPWGGYRDDFRLNLKKEF